jgi:hypothetical protein
MNFSGPSLKLFKPRVPTAPSWDPFRSITNDNCLLSYIPKPISALTVQNEDCSSTTQGGERPGTFDIKETFTGPGIW